MHTGALKQPCIMCPGALSYFRFVTLWMGQGIYSTLLDREFLVRLWVVCTISSLCLRQIISAVYCRLNPKPETLNPEPPRTLVGPPYTQKAQNPLGRETTGNFIKDPSII